jgi:hypothetical protein
LALSPPALAALAFLPEQRKKDIQIDTVASMELIISVQSRDRKGAGASSNKLRPLADARGSVR